MRSLKQRYQAKYGIKKTLRDYQLKAAAFGVANKCYGLLMDPRLGKTRIDIAVAGYLFLQGFIDKWVIVAPAIAKEVWATEISETLDVPHTVEIVEGKAEERKVLLKGWKVEPGKLAIMILNPEATWRLKKILYKTNPQKITLDESHRIKNHSAKQSTTMHVLGKRATYRCIMTGTFGKPVDAFSQFKFLDPKIFGERWKASRFRPELKGFLDQYVATYGFGGHKPKTFKNLDDLREKVASITYQLTRAEAGGFPTEHYQTIHFDLTAPAMGHYERMERDLKTVIDRHEVTASIILTQVLRLQQITGGFLPVQKPDENQPTNVPIGQDRLRALRGLMEEYPEDEPLVIFCKFRYELSAVIEAMKRMGRSVNFIAGGMKPGERDASKLAFQNGKVDTCVVQVRAGGIAIDLSRANNAIFYSCTSSYIDYEQAKARIIDRSGGSVSIIHLAARETIDDQILQAARENQDLAALVRTKFR